MDQVLLFSEWLNRYFTIWKHQCIYFENHLHVSCYLVILVVLRSLFATLLRNRKNYTDTMLCLLVHRLVFCNKISSMLLLSNGISNRIIVLRLVSSSFFLYPTLRFTQRKVKMRVTRWNQCIQLITLVTESINNIWILLYHWVSPDQWVNWASVSLIMVFKKRQSRVKTIFLTYMT